MTLTKAMALGLIPVAVLVGCESMGIGDADYHPSVIAGDFKAVVDNAYFPLPVGSQKKFIEKEGSEVREIVKTVTGETKTIMETPCTVVNERVVIAGQLAEDNYEYFAQNRDGTVWCFGEAVKEISPGGRISNEGSWEAGVHGAQPGIIMPGKLQPGDPYRQTYLKDQSEDMAQIVGLNQLCKVPAGEFSDCVLTKEWSMLDMGSEKKWYARGVGLVRTQSTSGEVLELMSNARE